jgi:hypothetical protein
MTDNGVLRLVMVLSPTTKQVILILLDDGERDRRFSFAQPGVTAHSLRLPERREVDHSIPTRISNMDMRRPMFTRRQKNGNAKTSDPQNRRHEW